jgi:hypothetical protein
MRLVGLADELVDGDVPAFFSCDPITEASWS